MVGVSAIALAGCNTTSNGFSGNALAILGSGAVNTTTHNTTSDSPASTDTLTNALIAYTDVAPTGFGANDTITVKVQNGGQVSGPMTYTQDSGGQNYIVDPNGIGPTGIVTGSTTNPSKYSSFDDFIPTPASATQDSILIAGAGVSSFAGFVGTNDKTTGAGNIAAGFGGVAPTGSKPTVPVTYTGNAATVIQEANPSTLSTFRGGTSTVNADFTAGTVNGSLNFSADSGPTIGFAGTMSSSGANYSASSVTYAGTAATGQVQGGFFGTNYAETAGVFDVQSTATGTPKATGAFGGHL